jgi:trimethylamine---corrinoid protein Co-methyltransferase
LTAERSGRRAACPPAVLDRNALDRLHRAGLDLLDTVGVRVRDDAALDAFAAAGARVDGTLARIPAGLVEQAVSTAPGAFDLPGRAADGSLDLHVAPGGRLFGNGTDTLYFRDLHTGERRRAVLADVALTAGVCEQLPEIDFVMSGVLPADVPLDGVDLAQFAAMLKATRKPLVTAPAGAGETLAAMCEMAEAAGRAGSFAVLGMTNPPLVLDGSCAGKARACGAAGVPFISGPGGQLGATTPVSVAGAVAVGHAETLAALVLHQLWNPGAPFVYGSGSGGAFDMRTFVDVWIAPEGQMADACAIQLATALGLPSWSYAGGCDSKTIDGQLAAEMAVTTLYAAQTGASLYHDLGEFEAAAQNSIESLVLGDALVGMTRRLLAGVRVDDETLQLEDIAAVGPGGSFLARPYTRAHHRGVWSSPLFDTSGFEAWAADGSRTLQDRLHEAALDLAARCAPVVDEAAAAAIDAYGRR